MTTADVYLVQHQSVRDISIGTVTIVYMTEDIFTGATAVLAVTGSSTVSRILRKLQVELFID